ncbi:MAG: TetR/AcrR family transcriptional regulator [Clostridia bacterium]|nr:TetR/AcrR family transcriptional regulator [Clostridia bacterium]
MDDVLKNMDADKKERIINSALKEFSERGFARASTNNIVKDAGISKGLLFHYFENKKNLLEYLENHVTGVIVSAIQNELDWGETDFFNRLKDVSIIKGRLTLRYPYIFKFYTGILHNKTPDEIMEYSKSYSPGLMEKIYIHNIDYSKFKPGLDMQRVMKIISWVIEKYGMELLDKLMKDGGEIDYTAIDEDFKKYLDILRVAFYGKD